MVSPFPSLSTLSIMIFSLTTISFFLANEHISGDMSSTPFRDSSYPSWRVSAGSTDDSVALDSVRSRAEKFKLACSPLGGSEVQQVELPIGGVAAAIRTFKENDKLRSKCQMPPIKACNVENFSVIIMSHNLERIDKLATAIRRMIFPMKAIGMSEIILIWNARSDVLKEAAARGYQDLLQNRTNTTDANAARILTWAKDPHNPLRMFFALKHHMTNSLLNRWDPSIRPSNEALVYFDDDGPFYTLNTGLMAAGFELWKRNPRAQVGIYTRSISLDVGPAEESSGFLPYCGGQIVYDNTTFPQFGGTVVLPSGSIIHRNYLCFLHHPAFRELRHFVDDHRTHPDDMMVSLLIGHLSGESPRLYARRDYKERKRNSIPIEEDRRNATGVPGILRRPMWPLKASLGHRRLLHESPNWFEYRTSAMRSLLGYFASIPPVSKGWCSGSQYHTNGQCSPEFPSVEQIPWMNRSSPHFSCTN